MVRYDVFSNPDAGERRSTPYLLDVQNSFIKDLATRVVVPLRRETVFGPRAKLLNPLIVVQDERCVLDTAALAAVPASELRKRVGDAIAFRTDIQAALDALFGAH
jgi:toxin CcdB